MPLTFFFFLEGLIVGEGLIKTILSYFICKIASPHEQHSKMLDSVSPERELLQKKGY